MSMKNTKVGRPKKHESAAARLRAWRQRQKNTGQRLDGYISSAASFKIGCLAKAWGCSTAEAIERIVLVEAKYDYCEWLANALGCGYDEAQEHLILEDHDGVLFPETKL